MSKWVRIGAMAIAAAALVVLVYAVLTPEPQEDDPNHGGMWGNPMTYSSTNVGLIAASIAAIVIAVMALLLWKEYEPLPPSMAPPRPEERREPVGSREEPAEAALEHQEPEAISTDELAERDYLVLRLLTGDERTMFKAIMDSGGEALQKDLILRTKMSNAKVSRLLDKLTQKGVVSKERHGATNRIKIRRGD
ncbi:MAG: hypothetical protein JW880_08230 [Candidatus Thermoplasmatota archaeon]|nr:hypothetical protein [Candidatus Thermoplasmatota archaeon]